MGTLDMGYEEEEVMLVDRSKPQNIAFCCLKS